MRCRASGCQGGVGRALQSIEQHIWISDELLDRSFRRFTKTVKSQRRHGSNVPGPLEARRRLDKRRMGGLSMTEGPASIIPSLGFPDFSSLFGSRPTMMSWTWKPPTCVLPKTKDGAALISQEKGSTRAAQTNIETRYDASLLACKDLDSIRQLYIHVQPYGSLFTIFSEMAFQRLLDITGSDLNGAEVLETSHLEDIFTLLQGTIDDPAARNTERLFEWLRDRTLSKACLDDIVGMIVSKLELRTIRCLAITNVVRDLPTIIGNVVQASTPSLSSSTYNMLMPAIMSCLPIVNNRPEAERLEQTLAARILQLDASPESLQLAEAIPDHWLQGLDIALVNILARAVARHTLTAFQSSSWDDLLQAGKTDARLLSTWVHRLRGHADIQRVLFAQATAILMAQIEQEPKARFLVQFWLQLLQRSDIKSDVSYTGYFWSFVFAEISPHFKPRSLANIFASLEPENAARVLFLHWQLPALREASQPLGTALRAPSMDMDGVLKPTNITYVPVGTWNPAIAAGAEHKLAAAFEDLLVVNRDKDPYIAALKLLNGQCTNTYNVLDKIVHDTFALVMQLCPSNAVYHFYDTFRRIDMPLPPNTAAALVRFFVKHNRINFAVTVCECNPRLWLSSCPELLFALARGGSEGALKVFELLNRPEYHNSVVSHKRTVYKNPLTSERSALIARLSAIYAESPQISARAAQRRIHDLYRYLQDRSAPVDKLLSRSLVHAGVTRRLAEGMSVSTESFVWILNIVRRTEGEAVANRLDKAAFTWRERIRDRAYAKNMMTPSEEQNSLKLRPFWEYGPASNRWRKSPRAATMSWNNVAQMEIRRGRARSRRTDAEEGRKITADTINTRIPVIQHQGAILGSPLHRLRVFEQEPQQTTTDVNDTLQSIAQPGDASLESPFDHLRKDAQKEPQQMIADTDNSTGWSMLQTMRMEAHKQKSQKQKQKRQKITTDSSDSPTLLQIRRVDAKKEPQKITADKMTADDIRKPPPEEWSALQGMWMELHKPKQEKKTKTKKL